MSKIEYKDDTLVIENLDVGGVVQSIINNPEYIEVKTDAERGILEGIRKDGTKVIGGDLDVKGKITIKGKGLDEVLNVKDDTYQFYTKGQRIDCFNAVDSMLMNIGESAYKYYERYEELIDNAYNTGAKTIRFITYCCMYKYEIIDGKKEPKPPISLDKNSEHTGVVDKMHEIVSYARSKGMEIMFCTGSYRYNYFDRLSENELDTWFEILALVINEFKDDVKYWEFNNEMDRKKATVQQMYDIQKRYYTLVKSIDPSLVVIGYGMAYATGAEKELISRYDYSNYVDIVNLHRYYKLNRAPVFDTKKVIEEFEWLYNILNNDLRNVPCWLTEHGGFRLEYGYDGNDDTGDTEKESAQRTVKTTLIALSFGMSRCFYWALEHILDHELKYSLKFLNNNIVNSPSYPVLKQIDGIYTVKWINNGKTCFAIWNEDGDKTVALKYSTDTMIYNYKGDAMTIADKDNFVVNNDVVFFIGTKSLQIELK